MASPEHTPPPAKDRETFFRAFADYHREQPGEVDKLASRLWEQMPPDERDAMQLYVAYLSNGNLAAVAATTRALLLSRHLEEQLTFSEELNASFSASSGLSEVA
jgi:hypothetical protein